VDGVEAEPVEAELAQPVERVADEELAHLGPAEVDRRPQGVLPKSSVKNGA
jgi:hypothetical protein